MNTATLAAHYAKIYTKQELDARVREARASLRRIVRHQVLNRTGDQTQTRAAKQDELAALELAATL